MKRLTSFLLVLTIALTVMAQGKLTPQAQLLISRKQTVAQRQALARGSQPQPATAVTLVVKIDGQNPAQTISQIKATGATVRSALGRQATISLPIDSVGALERIAGVVRIDKGHQGRLKTDVTRQVTGVSQLNGPTATDATTTYTGQGVTLCLIDGGIDFQHPAFKDAQGRSRIKCVYMPGSDRGNPFTVEDPEWGTYTMPGSVFDTPELIATLTCDNEDEYHGSHTLGIAAGSLSPQGFGGMAPNADIVLVPMGFMNEEAYEDDDELIEECLAFAVAYKMQDEQPMVLSMSANSHTGPHDGSSTVTEAIAEASKVLIPVFSAGNEGAYPIHLYRKFTQASPSVKTLLIAMLEDESGQYGSLVVPSVSGYTRTGTEVSVALSLLNINTWTGRMTTVWSSETVTATAGGEDAVVEISSDDVPALANYFEGDIGLAGADMGDGRLAVHVAVEGGIKKNVAGVCIFALTVSGADGTEIDLWDELVGFGGVNFVGLPGYVDGSSDMSAGDWTCTEDVISVGAYCANTTLRKWNGTTKDTSVSTNPDDDLDVKDDIAGFSSYGTSFNGVVQPVICAPGVNIVSAFNSYCISGDIAPGMQWEGYPYDAESGTSMSCPAVSGIIALWLQADPTLTLSDVKDIMAHSAVNDDFTSQNPIRWGYGKISATKGIEYIANQLTNGIHDVNTALNRQQQTAAVYDLQGRRVNGHPAPGLYVVNGRKTAVR